MVWKELNVNIEELIKEGNSIKEHYKKDNYGLEIISGREYADWLMKCSNFLETKYPKNELTKIFIDKAKRANGNFSKEFDDLVGILNSFNQKSDGIKDDISKEEFNIFLDKIFSNFHKMVMEIKNRHDKRATLVIKDEYDVQDLLSGVFKLFLDDVRKEYCVSQHAGANSRVDFCIPEYELFIETKMTRDVLKEKNM